MYMQPGSAERIWKKNDVVDIKVPMSLSLYVSRGDSHIVAFKYGGILLAGDPGTEPVRKIVTDSRDPEMFIKKTGDSLTFTIDSLLRPGNSSIALKPFYEFESEPHMAYWYLYTNEEYETMPDGGGSFTEQIMEANIDSVTPGHLQSELDHNYQHEGHTKTGIYTPAAIAPANGSWRDVSGGYISYDLEVKADSDNYLVSMFWGSDNHANSSRFFDILVEDTVLKENYELNNILPDQVAYYYLKIPRALTKGKEKVTVTYRADTGKVAGGVFGVRTTDCVAGKPEKDPVIFSEGLFDMEEADKQVLQKLLEQAIPDTEKEKHTEASWKVYQEAISDARRVDADISVTQEEVDAASVSGYAEEAMKWAVGTGIITGKYEGTRLDPQGYATRAECAIIIQRFLEQ